MEKASVTSMYWAYANYSMSPTQVALTRNKKKHFWGRKILFFFLFSLYCNKNLVHVLYSYLPAYNRHHISHIGPIWELNRWYLKIVSHHDDSIQSVRSKIKPPLSIPDWKIVTSAAESGTGCKMSEMFSFNSSVRCSNPSEMEELKR